MNYKFTGKNVTVTDAIKEKAMQKLDKLEKLLPSNCDVFVTIGVTKLHHILEVTIPINKRTLRAEISTDDLYNAFDDVVTILEKQILKYKGRLRQRSRKEAPFKEEFNLLFSGVSENENDFDDEEPTIKLAKTKRFALKPMDPEEAVMEMELLNHTFFVFRNSKNSEVNVVYKRKDGSYGLIEP